MEALEIVNKSLSIMTILAQVALVLVLLYWVLTRGRSKFVWHWINRNGATLSLIVVVVATLGSLFYSEVAGYLPCELCWYQRITMYPLVFTIFMSIIRRERKALDYSLGLAVVGLLFSLYHNYLYLGNSSSGFCALNSVSCLTQYMVEFQYVTIPVMSLTAFIMIIFLLSIGRREQAGSQL